MNTEEGLLAGICSHPHDDTPRLVYADWLDENGQPERAEFIRVQCELAAREATMLDEPCRCVATAESLLAYQRGEYCAPCERRLRPIERLLDRGREFLKVYGNEWSRPVCVQVGGIDALGPDSDGWFYSSTGNEPCWRFGRGFPAELRCTWADWLEESGPAIMRTISQVELMGEVPVPVLRMADTGEFLASLNGRSHKAMPLALTDNELLAAWCAGEWPGVTFRIPLRIPSTSQIGEYRTTFLFSQRPTEPPFHEAVGSINDAPWAGFAPRTIRLEEVRVEANGPAAIVPCRFTIHAHGSFEPPEIVDQRSGRRTLLEGFHRYADFNAIFPGAHALEIQDRRETTIL